MDQADIHEIREAVNRELVLAHDNFKERIEKAVSRLTRPIHIGRPKSVKQAAIYYVI